MALAFYTFTFVLAVLFTIIYVYMWNKHYETNITIIFVLIVISNLSYMFLYGVKTAETATVALKMLYIGGCFLPWFVTMCVVNLCQFKLHRVARLIMFLVNALMYCGILTVGYYPYFYKRLDFQIVDGEWIIKKTYGPLHTVFYIVIGAYLIAGIAIIIYTYRTKKQVSRKILYLLTLPEITSIMSYFLTHFGKRSIEFVPLTYDIALVVYLFIVRRMSTYDVSDMVIQSMVETGNTGFVSVDFKLNYLGSNETAKHILPQLCDLAVDQSIDGVEALKDTILYWIAHFEKHGGKGQNAFVINKKSESNEDEAYKVEVNYLYYGKRKIGYQIFLSDDTQNQRYIKLLDKYNSELEEEVATKTERIVMMHNNLVLSMATMVESRDNSTGGHIKRTSEGVRILIDEMKKDSELNLSEEFCANIIKAAPMHDLGKIAVDDAILRKPGRFTPEEFEVMKSHAPEGAKIVHEILKGTDDGAFKILAENVAHYHHERVDGSGYPEGLKGEDIPLEARIMAIADVYDALVSKRVYKEKMSFEEADKIIMEGMGTQFDEKLKKYYESARPKLEEYYSKQ
ncbi:MAG: HD domain-containing protein [Lachnospiraceae bacterium]|nr:HD domain-containing protein [Lachnospiraceae bacterium]